MLTSKQRSLLRSKAQSMNAIFQIGKGGLNDNMIKSIGDALEAKELIKISILDNSSEETKEAANTIAETVGADIAGIVGRKIILYKESSKAENRVISVEVNSL